MFRFLVRSMVSAITIGLSSAVLTSTATAQPTKIPSVFPLAEWTPVVPGCATEISILDYGKPYVIGCASAGVGGNQIFQREVDWALKPGAGVKLAANSSPSAPWILDRGGGIWLGAGSKQPGCAKEIASGGAGVWITGCAETTGGFEIFRASLAYSAPQGQFGFRTLTGVRSWQKMPGGVTSLAVGRQAWGVNDAGNIFRYEEAANQWQPVAGCARSIAANGDQVWVIGCARNGAGGYEIFERTRSGWKKHLGAAVKVSVDTLGNPWIVNESGAIFTWNRKTPR